MNEEDATNRVGCKCISWCRADALEDTSSKQAVEGLCFGSPDGEDSQHQDRDKDDGSPAVSVAKGHKEDVGNSVHQTVDLER